MSGSVSHLSHIPPTPPPFCFFPDFLLVPFLAKLSQKLEDREPKDAVQRSSSEAQRRGAQQTLYDSSSDYHHHTITLQSLTFYVFFLPLPTIKSRSTWLKLNQREKQRVWKTSEKSVTSDIHFLPSPWFNYFMMLINLFPFFCQSHLESSAMYRQVQDMDDYGWSL